MASPITIPIPSYTLAVNATTNLVYLYGLNVTGHPTFSIVDGESHDLVAEQLVDSLGASRIGVDEMADRVYVPDYFGGPLLVLDGSTAEIVDQFPLPLATYGIAVNPRTGLVYLSHPKDDALSVMDGETGTIVATISVGHNPTQVAVNANTNKIFVPNYRDNTVTVIDGDQNVVVATVVVGNAPVAIAMDEDDDRVYVANGTLNSSTVSVIDGSTNEVVDTIALGALPSSTGYGVLPTSIDIDPAHDRLFVSDAFAITATILDTTTHAVLATVGTGKQALDVAVNRETGQAYVAGADTTEILVESVRNHR